MSKLFQRVPSAIYTAGSNYRIVLVCLWDVCWLWLALRIKVVPCSTLDTTVDVQKDGVFAVLKPRDLAHPKVCSHVGVFNLAAGVACTCVVDSVCVYACAQPMDTVTVPVM